MTRADVLRRYLVVVALSATFGSCAPDPAGAPATSTTSDRPSTNRSSRGGDGLDLRGMLTPVPEYEGTGRNLFAYGAIPRPTPPPRPQTSPRPTPTVRATTTIPRNVPRGPNTRINVQYAGFVEKTEPTGEKAKYAIFLDGNEILAGAEGEKVQNRFTVVEIGLESVTVSAEGSTTTQRIPLKAN